MKLSQYFLPLLKEIPADAEVISHRLMLRSGMIRKLASGIYTWLPLGLRVLEKVKRIVQEEMNRAGVLEVLMPAIQPAELWKESGRWDQYGDELLRVTDRHDRAFCYGPTHEEVITDFLRDELRSYKQLPLTLYQIQTKFRDEIRPRFGVLRGREFLMKDAYSFNIDKASLEESYQAMYQTYCRIFERLGLTFRAVLADNGEMGGSKSQEFHVLADTGEDQLALSDESDYAVNVEVANVAEGDPSPDGKGKIYFKKGIEVGHIFQLDEKYTKPMKANVLNEEGKGVTMQMGCYGLGISRVVAAAIEQNHDDRGIIWPAAMSPFQVAIVPISFHKSYRVREVTEKLYNELQQAGLEVLLDDRKERLGVLFSTIDLIGIPHRIVINEKYLDEGVVEYKYRSEEEVKTLPLDVVVNYLKEN